MPSAIRRSRWCVPFAGVVVASITAAAEPTVEPVVASLVQFTIVANVLATVAYGMALAGRPNRWGGLLVGALIRTVFGAIPVLGPLVDRRVASRRGTSADDRKLTMSVDPSRRGIRVDTVRYGVRIDPSVDRPDAIAAVGIGCRRRSSDGR